MRAWIVCLFIAVLVAASVCLEAQVFNPEDLNLGYSITGGAAIPVNSNLDQVARPIFGISWYGSTSDALGTNSAVGLSAEWTFFKRSDDRDVNIVPVFFNYRVYGEAAGWRLFTNLGIGIIATTDPIPEMKLENGANFGWTAGFGIDLTNELFLQAKFIGSNNPGDDGLAGVMIGYRF